MQERGARGGELRLALAAGAALALLGAACEGPSEPPPPPDLSGVEPVFSPAPVTVAEAFGVAYQIPRGDDEASGAVRAGVLQRLSDLGVRWNRRDVLWHLVEPEPGARDFSDYDRVVDEALAAGVETVPLLVYGNPWATEGAGAGEHTRPPDDPADFARFAGAAAEHFRGRLSAYEIWNEENLGWRFWQPREDPEAYVELLRAAAGAIRDADPEAAVVLGGLLREPVVSTDAETFLEDLYFHGHPDFGDAFDVLAVHPYPLYPPHVAPEFGDDAGEMPLPLAIARLRAVMEHYGDDPQKPIWVTELGWPVIDRMGFHVDQAQQARWLVRSHLLLLGAGVERHFWFTLLDGPDPGAYPPEDAFGLLSYDDPQDGFDPAPKRSWRALSALFEVAGDLVVTADVTGEIPGAPADLFAYRLEDRGDPPARVVTALWRADDAAPPVEVTVPVADDATVTARDLLGEPIDGAPSVPVGPAPVYVIEDR